MEELFKGVSNVGFPIVIAFYLLVRIENKLELLANSISQLNLTIENVGKFGRHE